MVGAPAGDADAIAVDAIGEAEGATMACEGVGAAVLGANEGEEPELAHATAARATKR